MPKTIKDPIYGYITIEDRYIDIIDSVYFQRLRNIIQTSYTSIYPSALHNRFTHSLGVYWLGSLSFESLVNNSPGIKETLTKSELENTKNTFIMACLCHDLGHSPFSHTGEKFYNINYINDKLVAIVSNKYYKNDLEKEQTIVGKEHEIMSALLSIEEFGEIIGKNNFSLFARCIIGLQYDQNVKYSSKERKCLSLYRACVELLNSNIIDVDKLDYLIRDSYMSGYSSVAIDYQRLINGVFINEGSSPVGYLKSSLSVLESVLTANDMERRWIQSHPVILYESYLIKTIIREISCKYNTPDNELLSLPALTKDGVILNDVGRVRLVSDADVLCLAKMDYETSDAVKEYCDRSLRRHPVWKSEAEFSLLFDFKKNDAFFEIIKKWEKNLLEGTYGVYSINDTFYDCLKKELKKLNKQQRSFSDRSKKSTFKKRMTKLKVELEILKDIKNYLTSHSIPFDLVIITQQQFKSNIYKPAFKELPIGFKNVSDGIKQMSDASFLPLDTKEDNIFFYMYYRRNKDNNEIDVEEFSKVLRKAAIV